MAMKTLCPQIRHRESDVGMTEMEENEDKGTDCLQTVSHCPVCNQEPDVALILPCSHTMCGHCVAAGERTSSGQSLLRGVSPSVCSVLCPCCRHPVELPCSTWSFATSCLPKHPTLSPAYLSGETEPEREASEDQPQHAQGATYCKGAAKERAQSCLHRSHAASSSGIPVDGVVDLQEEEMEQSVFGLRFSLDPSSVPPSLHLFRDSLTVAYQGPPTPPPGNKFGRSEMTLPHICADVVIAQGQYYWEVDVCNSSTYRIGVISSDGSDSWWLERRGLCFCAAYDGNWEQLHNVPPHIKSLGVFLNIGGGTLSFHNPLTQEHLATLPTRFGTAGVLPAVGLGQGRLRLRCQLPPPPHLFLSKDSSYRRPCGADGGQWRREIPFKSVRKVIQKFEELAVSDADSGLVSSFGSSCSTLASLPDLGIPGMLPSGHTGQETRAE